MLKVYKLCTFLEKLHGALGAIFGLFFFSCKKKKVLKICNFLTKLLQNPTFEAASLMNILQILKILVDYWKCMW